MLHSREYFHTLIHTHKEKEIYHLEHAFFIHEFKKLFTIEWIYVLKNSQYNRKEKKEKKKAKLNMKISAIPI